jgi:hypothetical protein
MSHAAGDRHTYYHHSGSEMMPPEPYNPNMPRLRGGDAASRKRYHPQWDSPPVESGPRALPYDEDDISSGFCEIPENAFNASRKSRQSRRQESSATAIGIPTAPSSGFDFNDNAQPNPWAREEEPRQEQQRGYHDDHDHDYDYDIPVNFTHFQPDYALTISRFHPSPTGLTARSSSTSPRVPSPRASCQRSTSSCVVTRRLPHALKVRIRLLSSGHYLH